MLLWFLLAVGLLVFIHEMGHYLAARSVGLPVERFSVGFGRVLFRIQDRRGCEWALSMLPLGGYVKLNLEQAPLAARAWVVSAGPLANFLFAALAYAVLAGLPRDEPRAVLAQPAIGTPAALAGLRAGDEVLGVQGESVAHFQALRWALLREAVAAGDISVQLQVRSTGGGTRTVTLNVRRDPAAPNAGPEEALRRSGLVLQSRAVRVTQVMPGSPAALAGVMPGQVILAVNGTTLTQPAQLIEQVRASGDQPIVLSLVSVNPELPLEEIPGSAQDIPLTPQRSAEGQPRIGLGLGPMVATVRVQEDAFGALADGLVRTIDMAQLSVTALGRMLTGDLSWRQLSGPASIADAAGQSADRGSLAFLGFLALVSVSIGVLNLLPVPLLDGGHLLYYAIESVRGRPLSEGAQRIGQQLGLAAILLLTGLALASDLLRYFGS
jgi:regulator of sigma E protease